MNAYLRLYVLVIIVALVTACASEPRVQSMIDDHVNFSGYQTYNFNGPTEIENPDFSELIRLHYSAAIEQQMLERGYSKADNPDILINVSVDLKDMTSAPKLATRRPMYPHDSPTTACPNSGDYEGQVTRFASPSGSLTTLCEFKQGSVSIDMVGKDLYRTIWAGNLLVRIAENERPVFLIQNIVKDTNLLFENSPFPVRQQIAGLTGGS
ncbi:MAG: DUF4136 domain-containing protein [Xanthomonadales bacterium]|nr:DUF4136 domain-containing protein [Xanthomonadales bacterium]